MATQHAALDEHSATFAQKGEAFLHGEVLEKMLVMD